MKPVLLIGHDENETFGIAPGALRDGGVGSMPSHRLRGGALPPLEDVSGVVVFGGAMNVDMTDRYPMLAEERTYVRSAVDTGVPFLGICLGSQMLARAMDRTVYPAGLRELGFKVLHPTDAAAGDPLLSVFREGDRVFHWHEDTFELPEGATVLATGDEVRLQAFRIGELAWGVQFHLEIDPQELDIWLRAAGEDVVRDWGRTSAELREEAEHSLAAQQARATEVFRRFAGVARDASALSSRCS
jgi:GMP synthase (glutamine-hydrolysing)